MSLRTEYEIREATSQDISGMMALESAAGTAAHWREEDYRRIFELGGVPRVALVMKEARGLAGFIVANAVCEEWEIENVVVAEECTRRGIGTRLVRELVSAAHKAGATAVLLEVRESNVAARSLYEKCGFAEAGRRTGYYSGPEEHGLLYRCECTENDAPDGD